MHASTRHGAHWAPIHHVHYEYSFVEYDSGVGVGGGVGGAEGVGVSGRPIWWGIDPAHPPCTKIERRGYSLILTPPSIFSIKLLYIIIT